MKFFDLNMIHIWHLNDKKFAQLNIRVQSEIIDDLIIILIEDNGIGLTKKEKNQIFKQTNGRNFAGERK